MYICKRAIRTEYAHYKYAYIGYDPIEKVVVMGRFNKMGLAKYTWKFYNEGKKYVIVRVDKL